MELEARTVAWADAPVPPRYASLPYTAAVRTMQQECDRHGLRGNRNVLRMLLGREPVSFEQVATVLGMPGLVQHSHHPPFRI